MRTLRANRPESQRVPRPRERGRGTRRRSPGAVGDPRGSVRLQRRAWAATCWPRVGLKPAKADDVLLVVWIRSSTFWPLAPKRIGPIEPPGVVIVAGGLLNAAAV